MDSIEPFLISIRENPHGILILADWLEEQGRTAEANGLRRGIILPEFPTMTCNYPYLGDGEGYGYGNLFHSHGDGHNFCYDEGYGDGYGAVYSSSLSEGFGDGENYGDGGSDVDSYGDGRGAIHHQDFIGVKITMDELEIGQAYLWMTSDGWMWVARFVRRDGLFGVVVKDRVNVCRTGGIAWPDICQGIGRDRATFKAWPDVTKSGAPFPYAVPFARWEGEYPKG